MPRLRETMQLKKVPISEIEPIIAPVEKLKQISLFEVGQRDPVKLAQLSEGTYKYRVIDGRRRIAALFASEEQYVLALVKGIRDNKEAALEALISNSGTPNEYDEAIHIALLQNQYGMKNKEIARVTGYSESTISQRIKLLIDLHTKLQYMLQCGDINVSTAQEACRIPIEVQRERILSLEKITYKAVFEIVREWQGEQIQDDILFDLPEPNITNQGLYLSDNEIDNLMAGECVQIEYNGTNILIIKTDSQINY